MKKKTFLISVLLLFIMISLSSCAPEGPTDRVYGFFHGILHGFLIIIAVLGKIFDTNYDIYAQNNSGTWYWIGYFLGLAVFGGGSLFVKK